MPKDDGLARSQERYRDPLDDSPDPQDPRGGLTWPPSDEARSALVDPDPGSEDTFISRRVATTQELAEKGRRKTAELPFWDEAPPGVIVDRAVQKPPSGVIDHISEEGIRGHSAQWHDWRQEEYERGRAQAEALPFWDGASPDVTVDRPPPVQAIVPRPLETSRVAYDPCPGARRKKHIYYTSKPPVGDKKKRG